MSEKELADELDARKRLEGHGYTRKTCGHCRGLGMARDGSGNYHCFACEGKGYTWETPFMRHINRQP